MLDKQRRSRSKHSGTAPAEPDESAPETHETAVPLVPQRGLWLYLLVPITGILICGSKEPWALGILALLVGATMIFATPKHHVTAWLTVPVMIGLVLCLMAFLPASWFPLPEWRVALERDFGIAMSSTRSPQPGITWESWLALAVGAVWLVGCAARGFDPTERQFAIRVLAIFCSLLACAAILVHAWKIKIPFWRASWDMFYFGPFPNRNLFSELLAVGAVMVFAAAHDAFRRNQPLWILFAAAIVPIFSAVLLNTSRAGVIIFFLGIGAWMFQSTSRKRSAHRMAIAAAVMLVLAATFLLFGQHITERFFHREGSLVATLSHESRWQTFADAVKMIDRAPWLGVGLGNFEPVFALTRATGDLYSRALHPENDWLWFGAEAGIPCLALGMVGLIALSRRFGPWKGHEATGRRDRRLRNAAGIGVFLLCAAGMVDPPMHAPGFFALGSLLAGIALTPPTTVVSSQSRTLWLRRAAGAFCVLAGVAWIITASGQPVIAGNSVYRQLSDEALALSARGDVAGALEKWNEAAAIKPLQWNLYFERARLKLQLGRNAREALDDFARARRLEPHSALLCCREFDVWLDYDPVAGVPALGEALRRDPSRAVEFFQGRVVQVREHPELRPHFANMAVANPKLLLAYLPAATREEFADRIHGLLATHSALEIFTPEEKLRLFQVWYEKGDAADLIQRLEKNVNWRRDGWTVLAAHKAKLGDFRAAYEIALDNVPPPRGGAPRPRGDAADLARAFNLSPSDVLLGFDLYEAQRRDGKNDDALATLSQLAKLPQSPVRVLFERGVTLAAKGNYSLAWEALRDYHQRLQREQANPSS